MARDTQRNRIFRAEDAFNQLLPPNFGITETWKLQAFADDIVRRAWWKKQHGPTLTPKNVHIVHARYRVDCIPHVWNGKCEFQLDDLSHTRLHVLHRMAHALCGDAHMRSDTPHDVQFVKTYLELVRRFYTGAVDEDTKKQFKKCLLAERVKTKEVSEETREKQRQAMVKRMTPSEDKLLETLRSLEDL